MKIRIQQIADTSRKKRGRIALVICAVCIIAGSLLIGCAPLSAGAWQKTAPVQTDFLQEASMESSVPKEEEEVIEEEGEAPSESASDTAEMQSLLQAEIDNVFERIASDSQSEYAGGTMAWPAPEADYISAPYGWIVNGQAFHTGIDIAGKDVYGTPVTAAQDGTVAFINSESQPGGGYGYYIVLDHGGGICTLYAHLSEILVSEGESVVKGQQIGKIGATGYATGPHLHFEVRENGKCVDPSKHLLSEEEQKTA